MSTRLEDAIVHPRRATADREVLLEVKDLQKYFPITEYEGLLPKKKTVKAVDGVSFDLAAGETLGLVGESGCGKTTTGRLITRLETPTAGSITFQGQELADLSEGKLRPLRRELQMIFQDPYASLNPRYTVGNIIATPIRVHKLLPEKQIKGRVQELLELVGLNPEHINRYPNEFSGGQRQRIGIARALAVEPQVIVADEPVSALDVSIQAQVMNLMEKLRREFNLAFVFVAHDLGVVRHFCDRVAVMYLGRIVEIGDREQIYGNPKHPYTQALLSAAPDINVVRGLAKQERIRLEGDVPSPIDPPSGCTFRTRCWKAQDVCASTRPDLSPDPGDERHRIACHFPESRVLTTDGIGA
ncbi:peptide/nickel transport system ATP-binding protein/oligopeptide transport system ATP-binding protein [Kytococcus aerolatus]|uniref:Peptide/nickel transport system ATP-binding protein/oligopeptide transport system ATP-binding protein n=1 Tax=Kytococcus aerolatus TaxID=592308 RepID=A0A212SZJ1_9MICO|nr:dipeptide ABC transporter ATP-binding protein [Kytococcus aerolatus]SNC59185.1 peptide/nickel transport system ATP-binding protein/oligopeptide transport system ATP-binding protein [Kytococcus aerolatus]